MSLAFEPGRSIVGNAGVLVSRVLYVKEGVSHRFVIIDAAMNDLMRPALYGDKWGWHDIVPLKAHDPRAEPVAQSIVGPVCETGDTFAIDRPMAPLRDGDLIAILSAGAYGAVMSSSYNSRLPVPELLVKGADVRHHPEAAELRDHAGARPDRALARRTVTGYGRACPIARRAPI